MLTPDEVLRRIVSDEPWPQGMDWSDLAEVIDALARQLLDAREALRGLVGDCDAKCPVGEHGRAKACLPEHQEPTT